VQDAGLDVELEVAGSLPPLSQQTELAVVRIVQEALTNTLRHANATSAAVSLARQGEGIVLEVADNGIGGSGGSDGSGHGLAGMRERAAACGGRLEVDRTPAQGWKITAWFPASVADVTA
jgi:signal transduction histidine kinase